jgi:hypothetical protein
MTLVELKKTIHEKIDGLNDQQFLEHVAAIINNKEEVFIIPTHMKEGINQGKEDIKNGNMHSMEDFDKKYEKWLKA